MYLIDFIWFLNDKINNSASERVLQKNGFLKEAHILENELWEGKFLDTVIYSLLRRNFKK